MQVLMISQTTAFQPIPSHDYMCVTAIAYIHFLVAFLPLCLECPSPLYLPAQFFLIFQDLKVSHALDIHS